MPHNLFLHSSCIQTRSYPRTLSGRAMAIKWGKIDIYFALICALYVNAAILILAAAAFHATNPDLTDLSVAYKLLSRAVGSHGARILFGVSLLASGQSATFTGTLSGQIVMGGFLEIKIAPWKRRLITRLIAVVPAAIVAGISGQRGVSKLLVLSQVILSFTLIFAVVPLVRFTSDAEKMGQFVNSRLVKIVAWLIAVVIFGLNMFLVLQAVFGF
jgi:manganese transport protein